MTARITRGTVCVGCTLLSLLGVILVWHAAAQDQPKRLALVVGVNQYRKRGLAERPLRFAERDVTELAKVLTDQGFRVVTLTGDAATKEAIEKARDELLRDCNASDLVLLAFAGHGVQLELRNAAGLLEIGPNGKPLSDAYFCPVDAVAGDGGTMISLIRLFEILDQRGGINMIMADCCRDDPVELAKRGTRSFSGNELVGRLPKNSAILLSCAADQQAREHENAGGGHGVFFHQVIEGLKGRAANQSGVVSWISLTEFVLENVNTQAITLFPREARAADGSLQTPQVLSNLVARPILARLDRVKQAGGFAESIGIKIVPIKPGSFLMGSTPEQIDRVLQLYPDAKREYFADEQPAHRVEISRAFGLSAYEITVGQFRRFVSDTGYQTEAERDGKGGWGFDQDKAQFKQDPKYTWRDLGFSQGDDHPVVNVSYNDAQEFCAWLSKKDGRTYRLPTEAQWEYACRAGSDTLYSNGDDPEGLAQIGNVADAAAKRRFPDWPTIAADDGYVFTAPVGRYEPNRFGLYDMHGNVWEWCLDYYGKDYYKESPASDPEGPAQASHRVFRGGGWDSHGWSCRSAGRCRYSPDNRGSLLGFRVARVPSSG